MGASTPNEDRERGGAIIEPEENSSLALEYDDDLEQDDMDSLAQRDAEEGQEEARRAEKERQAAAHQAEEDRQRDLAALSVLPLTDKEIRATWKRTVMILKTMNPCHQSRMCASRRDSSERYAQPHSITVGLVMKH